MKKWDVEMSYGIGFTISGIEAETREEAIEAAQRAINEDVNVSDISEHCIECGGFEFEQVNFVQEAK